MSNESSASAVSAPAAKMLSVWAVFGLTSWSEVAAALSALYTFFLLLELAFNKFGRPYCEKRGWLKRRRRRRGD